jgi:4-amino-4-deoxy-L-arabinose transferase-like glycosyltransferase
VALASLLRSIPSHRTLRRPIVSPYTLALVAVLTLPFLLAVPFLNEPFEKDEGTYATVARGLLDGQLPYRDLFDHKPPLVYVWYAVSFLLFGEYVWAPRVLAALSWSATAALVWVLVARYRGEAAALASSMLLAAFSGIVLLQANANTEIFTVLPLVGSLYAFARALQGRDVRWFLAAGVLGGAAALTKQVAVTNMIALSVLLLLSHRTEIGVVVRGLAWMTAGALVTLGVALVPFVLTSSMGDFFYATVHYNQLYSGTLSLHDRLVFALRNLPYSVNAALLPIALVIAALWDMRARRRDLFDQLSVLSLVAACAGTVLSGFFFPHYFVVLLPFTAILGGPLLVMKAANLRQQPVLLALLLVTAGFTLAANLPAFMASSPEARHAVKFPAIGQAARENSSGEVAEAIRSLSRPGDTIYNYGRETQLYFYADREAAIPQLYDRVFWLDPATLPEAMGALQAKPPKIIVDTANHAEPKPAIKTFPDALGELLAARYELVKEFPYADIYLLQAP